MKLSDIMSSMGYAAFAEAALVLFFLAFLGVAVGLLFGQRERYDAMRGMALEEAAKADGADHEDRQHKDLPVTSEV